VTSPQPSFLQALAAATVLHGAVLGWVWVQQPAPHRTVSRRPPTTVKLVTRPPPLPPAPAAPAKAAAPRPVATPLARPAAPLVAPSLGPAPPPAGPPPRPRRFAVSMSATAPGGGVAVPVTAGPTAARGNPLLPSSAPVGDNTAFAQAAADVTEVERAPQLLRQPSSLDLRALYPERARREGIEGDVRLELLVTAAGAVSEVRVLERAGHGFDEVAEKAARLIVFRPAERGGRPVAVRIPWILKFRLDG
jgi:protein TonB